MEFIKALLGMLVLFAAIYLLVVVLNFMGYWSIVVFFSLMFAVLVAIDV